MMKKLRTLNQDGFKKFLPDEPSAQIIHFCLPRGALIPFKSSFNMKFPLNITMHLKCSSWAQDKVITNELRGDALHYKEIRNDDGDTIEITEISLNEDVDFYLNQQFLEEATEFNLVFKFMNKEKEIIEEKGEISKQNLQDLFKIDPEDHDQRPKFYENNYILVLIRPSNLKLFLGARKLINHFLDNPVGKFKIHFHRLIKIKDDDMKSARSFTDMWDDIGNDYWVNNKVYKKEDRVIFGTNTYRCTGDHRGKDPKKNYSKYTIFLLFFCLFLLILKAFWNFIGDKEEDDKETEEWNKFKIYNIGDKVHHVGLCYKCTGNNLNI